MPFYAITDKGYYAVEEPWRRRPLITGFEEQVLNYIFAKEEEHSRATRPEEIIQDLGLSREMVEVALRWLLRDRYIRVVRFGEPGFKW